MNMIYRTGGILTLVCAMLSAAGTARADEAVEFRYRMGPDDRLVYRSTAETELKQKVGDADIETAISQTEVAVRTLQETDDDGNFRVQSENKGLQIEVRVGPLGEYTYDSKAADNEKGSTLGGALTPVYDTLRGAYTWVTISPLGKVLKVEGLEELFEGVLKDNPIGSQFVAGGSADSARLQYSELYLQFPEKALRPGDAWEVPYESTLPGLGTIKGNRKFRYVGNEEADGRLLARFSETQEVSFELDLDMPDVRVTGTLSVSDSSGTIRFDRQRGLLVSKTSTVKLAGTFVVRAGDMDLNLRQEQTQKTTLELLDELPD